MSGKLHRIGIGALLFGLMFGGPSLAAAAQVAPNSGTNERLIVVARSDADYDNLRSEVEKAGGSIVQAIRGGRMLVATGASALKGKIQATGLASGVANDHIEALINPAAARDFLGSRGAHSRTTLGRATSEAAAAAMGHRAVTGDPAFSDPGLMWDVDRIHAPAAWRTTTGSPSIKVGVEDTGLDYTHAELASKVAHVQDFTSEENPPICSNVFPNPLTGQEPGLNDSDLAKILGGPPDGDFSGHGSWIGGNIAAALDGEGVNGIAPSVELVSLKVAEWCGLAYDSTIMDAFLWAGEHNVDVVSISIGGFLDLTDPSQAEIWGLYNQVVQKVRGEGTLIVASAGNEHVRLGTAGVAISHGPGQLPCTPTPSSPCPPFADVFGQFEAPGGVPGVDYSNYGRRIDLAGPGGARKFNLPNFDRGGTPGFPFTDTYFTTAFEDFNITSNFAPQAPCFTFTGGGFPANQCYSTIQGTSMATPHVSAAAALILSADSSVRKHPERLERALKSSARRSTGNETQELSATDTSKSDLTDQECLTGYCHLGGQRISDRDAYGAGIVDARRAVDHER